MFGIVIVSHSRILAESLSALASEISGKNIPIAFAGGVEGDEKLFGTDATDILDAVESVYSDEGVLVFADMGSALISTETALDFMDAEKAANVYISPAPMVEGVISAAVQCGIGSSIKASASEAEESLFQKIEFLKKKDYPSDNIKNNSASPGQTEENIQKRVFRIKNKNGLHARPASKLIKTVSASGCRVEVSNITGGRGPANALSLNRLSSLEVLKDDEVLITASGDEGDVLHFFEETEKLINNNFGEDDGSPDIKSLNKEDEKKETGLISLSEGIALGRAYILSEASIDVKTEKTENCADEIIKLESAVNEVKSEIKRSIIKGRNRISSDKMQIIETHLFILDDPDLFEESRNRINKEKITASSAWSQSAKDVVKRYENLEDIYLKTRSSDIRDVSSRVLNKLTNNMTQSDEIDAGSVVIAEKLIPSQVLRLDPDRISGILVSDSSTSSHAAILAKSLGIPSIGGYDKISLIKKDDFIVFDSALCEVFINPDEKIKEDFLNRKETFIKEKLELQKISSEHAFTREGKLVQVNANISSLAEAYSAVKNGADGIGVLRTEFLFLEKNSPPSEEEQFSFFSSVFKIMDGRPVTVRTLDIGGDKQVPYMNLPVEDNPFLGLRGVRIYSEYPDIIKTHIRALLRAGFDNDLKIMIPMISKFEECSRSYDIINKVHLELEEENIDHIWPVEIGIMIETPASVVMADELAGISDFFSIGTNDLTQYTLAAERGNPDLAKYSDPYDPAVIRRVRKPVLAAEKAGIDVSLCGELGGDTEAVPLLIGLGITSLSMNPHRIPEVKKKIRNISDKQCKANFVSVLFKAVSPDEVKKYMQC